MYTCAEGCGFRGNHREVAQHEKHCNITGYICQYYCGYASAMFTDVENHEKTCSYKESKT